MKKLLSSILIVLCAFSLFACKTEPNRAEQIKAAFTVPFEYTAGTQSFAFVYSKTPEKTVMTLTEPETLKGLAVTKTPSGVTASYDDLVVTMPENTVQKLLMLDTIAEKALAAANSGEYAVNADGENAVFMFTSGDDVYSVTLNAEGKPVSASAETGGRTYGYKFVQ